jgi:simple sugar transport system permease protein
MATSEMTIKKTADYVSPTRQRVMGILFLLIAFSIWFFFSRSLEPGLQTTFGLTPGGSETQLPDWIFTTAPVLNILALVCAILGGAQLARGFGSRTNLVLAWVAGIFIFSFLAWGASGGSLNMAGLLRSSLVRSVPITIGALSGVLCERAGVVNIAIEGMMLTGAMTGTLVGSLTNMWIGLLAAVAVGGLLGLGHAILSIRYKADQIISGTVINIGAVGITSFISAKFLQKYQELKRCFSS